MNYRLYVFMKNDSQLGEKRGRSARTRRELFDNTRMTRTLSYYESDLARG